MRPGSGALILLVGIAACGDNREGELDAGVDAAADAAGESFAWDLPPGFPTPLVPADNPMSAAKVELGRRLFYDTRLSGNQTFSCASCHAQARAFTDGRAVAIGSTGELHPRNSMGLTNVAYLGRFVWANPVLSELEQQALGPMFGFEPVELGLRNLEDELLARLKAEPIYQDLFARSFEADADPVTVANVVKGISAFERVLISGRAPFDRWQHGEATAISASAIRGHALFNSEKCECFHCHSGFNLQDTVRYVGHPTVEARFHNTALYNIDGLGGYPAPNTGIYAFTNLPADMGRFRTPSLRNIAVTAPYFHDGSAATLDDVLDHYAAAGRTIASGPNAGVGSANPYKSSFLIGFTLSAEERADLHAFFDSLTDDTFLTDPRFADPWR
ncbi:MAG: di-heme enzyme [Proteobacteria bacterium]|nr:di-heme enzyme [Pseudomonadota bacterium]